MNYRGPNQFTMAGVRWSWALLALAAQHSTGLGRAGQLPAQRPGAGRARLRMARAAADELLALCRRDAPRAEVEAAIDALPPSPRAPIDGRWRLEWTTEKEVLFLKERGSTGIFQDICLEAGRLEQLVLFESGCLRVGSTASAEPGSARVAFSFDSCAARWGGVELPLPPTGSGWFDTVYVDEAVRVSRDVRGDTQVVTRAGASELYRSPDAPASVEQAVGTLKRAAATKAVGSDAVVNALLCVERRMREACKMEPRLAAAQLEKLDGSWRLIFTTGTLDTQARLGGNSARARALHRAARRERRPTRLAAARPPRAPSAEINYFPLAAVQRFDTKPSPMRIENGIYLDDRARSPLIRFSGAFEWLLPQRRLEFDFDRISLFGDSLAFDLPKGGAAELGAASGLGSKGNTALQKQGKKPFFLWAYADDSIAIARGAGGGIALWQRTGLGGA